MTEPTNVELDGVVEPASPAASDSAVAVTAEQVSEIVANALKPLKGEIGGLYSRQDKDRNAYSELLDEFKKQKANGLDDTAATAKAESVLAEREKASKQERVLEALAARFLNEPSTQPVGNGESGAVDTAKAFEMAGLDVSDPRVVVAMKKQYANEDAAIADAVRLSKAIQNSPTPTAAQSASLQGAPINSNLSTSDVDTKTAQLLSLYSNPTVNAAAIQALETELDPYLPK